MAAAHALPGRIVFAGLARDSAGFLPAALANLDRLAACFESATFVIAENDSVDATKAILANWSIGKGGAALVLNLDGLGAEPVRTLRIEFARNTLVEYIRALPRLAGADWLCLVDLDDALARPIAPEAFVAALRFLTATPHAAGVFANQIGTYYDMWALRHRDWCPGDVWYDVLAKGYGEGLSDEAAFAAVFAPRVRSIPVDSAPIEVDSAFGGLGLYRLPAVLANPNPYLGARVHVIAGPDGRPAIVRMQACEHVHFHAGLRQLGHRLFILPGLVNRDCTGLGFPPAGWRNMVI